jgi:phosphatidylinositol-3,4,5-trisphosphate 3-phosphatase/dual-specificity protein phosphatase PTEN
MVREYKWEDHHSPAMSVLFEVCQAMHDFLAAREEHIVIVNCNAGKGRTGTSISCFLMFSGLAANATDAITYYGWKRFEHGRGVTQPSQVRYIHYFEGIFKRMVQSPSVKILDKIVITTVPRIGSDGCTPYVEVLSGRDFDEIWSNRHSMNLKTYKTAETQGGVAGQTQGSSGQQQVQRIVINVDKDPLLCGDIYFRLMHKGSLKSKLICRFALNTSFI